MACSIFSHSGNRGNWNDTRNHHWSGPAHRPHGLHKEVSEENSVGNVGGSMN